MTAFGREIQVVGILGGDEEQMREDYGMHTTLIGSIFCVYGFSSISAVPPKNIVVIAGRSPNILHRRGTVFAYEERRENVAERAFPRFDRHVLCGTSVDGLR